MIWNRIIVRDVKKIYKLAINKMDLSTALKAQRLLAQLHISQVKHDLELMTEERMISNIPTMDEMRLEEFVQNMEHRM